MEKKLKRDNFFCTVFKIKCTNNKRLIPQLLMIKNSMLHKHDFSLDCSKRKFDIFRHWKKLNEKEKKKG